MVLGWCGSQQSLAFFMAFGIGANDVSNSMGTSVGSGTITAKQAIIIALIFESAGAYLAGGEVTQTIKSGVIDPIQICRYARYFSSRYAFNLICIGCLVIYCNQNGLASFWYTHLLLVQLLDLPVLRLALVL
ncbi:putative phosphate permease [Haemophilus influenzae]|uniref:Putative phosphate permease n=1 Tax=Haemophilus influenzae TaxID=727 RepID=A0A2X1PNP1_HAEIF|nr:putative phosphate permease [Haemophilus influenzae]